MPARMHYGAPPTKARYALAQSDGRTLTSGALAIGSDNLFNVYREASMNREPIQKLIDACNRKDIESALTVFTEDAVYHNIPLEPVSGIQAIRDVLGPFLSMAAEVEWIVHHWADGAHGIVMNERTDRFLIDGTWLELPVMGVFEVEDGRIRAWRDYFDLQRLMPAGTPPTQSL